MENRKFFFFNDTATTEIYPLSLHDALPISATAPSARACRASSGSGDPVTTTILMARRSEEHTSELQSQSNIVCRLLLEKKQSKFRLRIGPMSLKRFNSFLPASSSYKPFTEM